MRLFTNLLKEKYEDDLAVYQKRKSMEEVSGKWSSGTTILGAVVSVVSGPAGAVLTVMGVVIGNACDGKDTTAVYKIRSELEYKDYVYMNAETDAMKGDYYCLKVIAVEGDGYSYYFNIVQN